ncbi:MAG: ABC transporter ATP-binding protein [Chitinispirillaceae bacterium]|nr:ABC transporter ATP-binding protein [Chitinispirillaceae bacterium]
MSAVIAVEKLRKRYEATCAVNDLSFTMEKSCLFGLVGADGAGKSTLLRMLTTLIPPDAGDAVILGGSIRTDLKFIRSHIGFMPQHFSLYGDMSVAENLHFFADIFGVTGAERRQRVKKLLAFSHLAPFIHRPAAKLSGGMKQKLALCCALIHTPQVLLLDEPTTGVDPVSRREFWEILAGLRNEGIAVLIATPYMDEATWCDDLIFMHQGNILSRGAPAALIDAFPAAIFRVTGSKEDEMLYCPASVTLPEGIESIYASGGALHVVCDKRAADPSLLLERVGKIVPGAGRIEPCTPGMEDLFFREIATVAAAPPMAGRNDVEH